MIEQTAAKCIEQNIEKMAMKAADKLEKMQQLNNGFDSQFLKQSQDGVFKKDVIDNPYRPLNENDALNLKDKLNFSDKQIDKCSINDEKVIRYRTDRCDLEGDMYDNRIPYERNRVEINGITLEGVFPKFKSLFDYMLPPDKYKTKAYAAECNKALRSEVNVNPELAKQFSADQLEDIKNGRTPRGCVWHHNEKPGLMQLVKEIDHDKTKGGAPHTGGDSLWGPKRDGNKGVEF